MTTTEKINLAEEKLANPSESMGLKQHIELLFNVYPSLLYQQKAENVLSGSVAEGMEIPSDPGDLEKDLEEPSDEDLEEVEEETEELKEIE